MTREPYNKLKHWGFVCRCGHEDHLEAFCETPIGGPLPIGTMQCPACGFAWRKRRPSEGKWRRAGEYLFVYYPDHPDAIDDDNQLIQVPTRL